MTIPLHDTDCAMQSKLEQLPDRQLHPIMNEHGIVVGVHGADNHGIPNSERLSKSDYKDRVSTISVLDTKVQPAQQKSGFEDDTLVPSCRHPDHAPPTLLCVPHGKVYRHVCPACGYTVRLRSSAATL